MREVTGANAVLSFASEHRKGVARTIGALAIALVFLILVVSGDVRVDLHIGKSGKRNGMKSSSGSGYPVEFLYLDTGRTGSYLAQIDDGALEDEKVTSKVKSSLKATLEVAETLEGGASEEKEEGEELEVKPTEASRFLELRAALREAKELRHPLAKSEQPRPQPQEGEFVEFRRAHIFSPAYLKPYLIARRAEALRAALGTANEQGAIVRRNAKTIGGRERFLRRLGEEPRAVLSVKSHRQGIYLLPIETRLLSPERSLFESGGGHFTVVGKVVRIFDKPGDGGKPAYEDSATREEWLPALKAAPERLICRSATTCASAQHEEPGRLEPMHKVRKARWRDLKALHHDTVIRKEGAVILPIAIYK